MDKFPKIAQNVVIMTDHTPHRNHALLSQVEAYWDALWGNNLLPRRSDIDPRGIENALEFTFILERIAPGLARVRLAGSHLCDLMGMEVRGMPITALLAPSARCRFGDMMEELFETPATAVLTLADPAGPNFARMLLLPLQSDMGDTSRMLGCLVSDADSTTTPCRFNIQHINITPVDGAARAAIQTPRATARGLSEQATPFKARTRPPYLRLVKSDEQER